MTGILLPENAGLMPWLSILKILKAHFDVYIATLPVPVDTEVMVGDHGGVNPSNVAVPIIQKQVLLRRGPSQDLKNINWQSGTETVWIQCWVTNPNDAPVSGDADDKARDLANTERLITYEALADLERTVLECVLNLSKELCKGYALKIEPTTILPDGDYFRPEAGSQITLTINWRLTKI